MNKTDNWNSIVKAHQESAMENATTTVSSNTLEEALKDKSFENITSTHPYLVEPEDNNAGYIFIPLAVLLGILLLSAVVFLMARNRRRLVHIYCKHAPTYAFNDDSDDSAMEQCGDFDDPTECLLKGKLQIDNRHENYNTTQVTKISAVGQSRINA